MRTSISLINGLFEITQETRWLSYCAYHNTFVVSLHFPYYTKCFQTAPLQIVTQQKSKITFLLEFQLIATSMASRKKFSHLKQQSPCFLTCVNNIKVLENAILPKQYGIFYRCVITCPQNDNDAHYIKNSMDFLLLHESIFLLLQT